VGFSAEVTSLSEDVHGKSLHLSPTQMDRVRTSHTTHGMTYGSKIHRSPEQGLRTSRDARIIVPNRPIQVGIKTL
jgi:hypothetical protein